VGVKSWATPILYDRCVVIGGGSGIGRALALELAACGTSSYVLGRRLDVLEETANLASDLEGRVVPIACDARDPSQVDKAFEQIEHDGGPAQSLVNCAVAANYQRAADITFRDFEMVVRSTLFIAFNVLHRWAAPLLDGNLPGVAVSLTSTMASDGTPGIAHSSAGKAGVEAYSKSIAREWGPRGIRVNVVGPGFFPTDRLRSVLGSDEGNPIRNAIALDRFGDVGEIVGPIAFLLSKAGAYITGEVLRVDGGFRLTPWVMPKRDFGER